MEDATMGPLIALAEAIKTLQEYRDTCERILRRSARYVRVADRQKLTALDRKVEQALRGR